MNTLEDLKKLYKHLKITNIISKRDIVLKVSFIQLFLVDILVTQLIKWVYLLYLSNEFTLICSINFTFLNLLRYIIIMIGGVNYKFTYYFRKSFYTSLMQLSLIHLHWISEFFINKSWSKLDLVQTDLSRYKYLFFEWYVETRPWWLSFHILQQQKFQIRQSTSFLYNMLFKQKVRKVFFYPIPERLESNVFYLLVSVFMTLGFGWSSSRICSWRTQ